MEISKQNPMPDAYLQNTHHVNSKVNEVSSPKNKEDNIVETMEKAAAQLNLSMNAQIVLFSMDTSELNKENITGQKEIFDFLSGKILADGSSLDNIGYKGKPITELSVDEAKELLNEDGFFGIKQTSDRVASFALGFSDDPEIIKKALEGIKQGFEEAEQLWGGELPQISYKTQERTIQLVQEHLAKLENKNTKENTEISLDQQV